MTVILSANGAILFCSTILFKLTFKLAMGLYPESGLVILWRPDDRCIVKTASAMSARDGMLTADRPADRIVCTVPRRYLFVGEEPRRSAPFVSLAAELAREGVATEYSQRAETDSNRNWLRLARRSDVVVIVHYGCIGDYTQRQLHIAKLCGCMLVRWWVGTDVLNCLRSPDIARAARSLDPAVDLNLAVAPHLVEELASIGISAQYSPSVCNLATVGLVPPGRLPSSVLVYLPTDRRRFYGEHLVVAAAEANPDLGFTIVSDDSHALAHLPNVRSLGWIEDMERLWPQVGLLLRMTEHDGMPRMVLEALARGRYVIYRWPMAGCWYADSLAAIQRNLDRFRQVAEPNMDGPRVAQHIAFNAARRFVDAVDRRHFEVGRSQRLRTLVRTVHLQGAIKGWLPRPK